MKIWVSGILFCILAVAITATVFYPDIARAEKYSLVRCYLDSPGTLEFILAHPGLDIASVKKGSHVDIVARMGDITALRNSGARFEIIHSDVGAYYASLYEASTTFAIRTHAEAVAFMDNLHALYPNIVSAKWSLGQSHEGRDVWCFRMSDNPDIDEAEPEILFDGLHHAWEIVGYELILMLAEHLAQKYGSDPHVTYLLDRREIYFVPIVNPDGLVYNETNATFEKKNRRDNSDGSFGVDLNRNYPYMWGGAGGSADPSAANYRGPFAGSEPEVQALMGLVNSHQFVTHQSYHSTGAVTFYPWSYTSSATPDSTIFAYMGDMMTKRNFYDHGQVGAIFVLVSGTTIDWSYGAQSEHNKIFAFTNEIGGLGGTLEETVRQIFHDNLWPTTYLIRAASSFIEVSDQAVLGGDGNGRLDPGESAGLSFTVTNQGVTIAANGVDLTLSSNDSYVQLGSAFRNLGTLSPRSSVDFVSAPFPVTIDPACPEGHLAEISVSVDQPGGALKYILAFVVGEPIVLFSDDFEDGIGAWTTTGTWDLTTTFSNSPSNSLTDSPGGDYANETRYTATLSDSITATSLCLSFWHRYEIEDRFDKGLVQISADSGPWVTLAIFTGFSTSWRRVELPLSEYIGQAIRVRFLLDADGVFPFDGWYIDDVILTGSALTNQTPLPPVSVSPDAGEVVSTDPVLTVANSTDPDGSDLLTYGFRVYGDSLCTNLVASVDDLAEGSGQTSWQVPSLPDTTYWWRAYAADSTEWGLLGEKRMLEKNELVALLIQRFDAKRIGAAVRLEWELLADEPLAGFNIYRKEGRDGYAVTLNKDGLIPEADRSFDDTDFEAGQNYYYALGVVRPDGSEVSSPLVEVRAIAYTFSLGNNYPNPFNPVTTITYSIPKTAHVTLRVYDAQGRLIKSLVNGQERAGEHTATWNGEDAGGSPVASGVYFARLQSNSRVQARKIVLLK